MTPERKEQIGQHVVEAFYWNGRMVVYVNNVKVEGSFEDVCAGVRADLDHQFEQSTLHS